MAITATVNIAGQLTGLITGSRSIQVPQIMNVSSVDVVVNLTLSSGDNDIGAGITGCKIPAGAIGVIITPAATNATTLKVLGAAGTTGAITLSKTKPAVFTWDAVPSNFNINASDASAVVELLFF